MASTSTSALLMCLLAAGACVCVSAGPGQFRLSSTGDQEYTSEDVEIAELGTPALLALYGYDCEIHNVTTSDDYVLTMHRIPNKGKTPVFLMHGILSSSADWVVTGTDQALALILYDQGYDVWMGNARGNKFSLKNLKYSVDSDEFWDFSWHEIGIYDLPAMIDYVLANTSVSNITYIGHSQGTTSFFVMGSLLTEYNDKITAMHALAPVAYMNEVGSKLLKFISHFTSEAEFICKLFGVRRFLPSSDFLSWFEDEACKNGSLTEDVCLNALFIIVGYDPTELNTEQIPMITANVPAGSSVKQIMHYGQLTAQSKAVFRQFDYGHIRNLIKYWSWNPPSYPVDKITAPVYLHYGENDLLGTPDCTKVLSEYLPNLKNVSKVALEKWNHIDFLYAVKAPRLLYDQILKDINTTLSG